MYFFFFKQKTAYEVRISDWSSDVCSSDLRAKPVNHIEQAVVGILRRTARCANVDRSGEGRAHGVVSRRRQQRSILPGAMTQHQLRSISWLHIRSLFTVPPVTPACWSWTG